MFVWWLCQAVSCACNVSTWDVRVLLLLCNNFIWVYCVCVYWNLASFSVFIYFTKSFFSISSCWTRLCDCNNFYCDVVSLRCNAMCVFAFALIKLYCYDCLFTSTFYFISLPLSLSLSLSLLLTIDDYVRSYKISLVACSIYYNTSGKLLLLLLLLLFCCCCCCFSWFRVTASRYNNALRRSYRKVMNFAKLSFRFYSWLTLFCNSYAVRLAACSDDSSMTMAALAAACAAAAFRIVLQHCISASGDKSCLSSLSILSFSDFLN